MQCMYFKMIFSSLSQEEKKSLLHNTHAPNIPARFTVACPSQIWLFRILWQYKALQTLSLPRGMLALVRSTWPNQYYYKTLGKCYIRVLLIHSTALTGHDCMWKIWWLASLLTYWDSLLLLWKICHIWITWHKVIPESPSRPRYRIYLQVHQTPVGYQISISLFEIQKFWVELCAKTCQFG